MATTAITPKHAAQVQLGVTALIELTAIPAVTLTLVKPLATVIDTLDFSFEGPHTLTGTASLLPDLSPATLYVKVKQDGMDLVSHAIPVILKPEVPNAESTAFKIIPSPGQHIRFNAVSWRALGKGGLDFEVVLTMPFSPSTSLENSGITFDLPFEVHTSKKGSVQMGQPIELTPPKGPLYEKYGLKVEVLEHLPADDKNSKSLPWNSLEWKAKEKASQTFYLGKTGDALSVNNHGLQEDYTFDLRYSLIQETPVPKPGKPVKVPGPIKLRTVEKVWSAPVPELVEINTKQIKTDLAYYASHFWLLGEYADYGYGKTAPGYRITLQGQFANFYPETFTSVDLAVVVISHLASGEESAEVYQNEWHNTPVDASGKFQGMAAEMSLVYVDECIGQNRSYRGLIRVNTLAIPVTMRLESFMNCHEFPTSNQYPSLAKNESLKSSVMGSMHQFSGAILGFDRILLTVRDLQAIDPDAKVEDLEKWIPSLNRFMAIFGINTPLRMSHFLAQCAHESGHFKAASQIGTTAKYRGRGLIQVTGEGNYQKFTDFLRKQSALKFVDCVQAPDTLLNPEMACLSACWYWVEGYRRGDKDTSQSGNEAADANLFVVIVKDIIRPNPDLAHYKERFEFLKRAFGVFKVEDMEGKKKDILAMAKQVKITLVG